MRLYELTGHYLALRSLAEEGEDMSEALSALDDELASKAEGVAHVLRELDLDAAKLDAEIKRLTAKKKALASNTERLKSYVLETMLAAKCTSVKAATFTLAVQQNPPSVEITNAGEVPREYVTTTTVSTVSKTAILANYRETGEVPAGCSIERGNRLVIK